MAAHGRHKGARENKKGSKRYIVELPRGISIGLLL